MSKENLKKAMRLLFKRDDKICVGNQFAVDVGSQPIEPVAEFFSINPLHGSLDHKKEANGAIRAFKSNGRRADLNVTSYNNFLFEIDSLPLDRQLQCFSDCGVPWATITYSGGKSYHAILSLEKSPVTAKPHTQEAVDEYKRIWQSICAVLTKRLNQPLTLFDSACQNPSRLSRTPGAVRPGTEKLQHLQHFGRLCSSEEFAAIMQEAPDFAMPKHSRGTSQRSRGEEEFKMMLPVSLMQELKYPKKWASGTGEGNYGDLYRLVSWAIDSCGVDKETLTTYMEKYTFPYLVGTGYPLEKCYKPINDAFKKKGEQ
jgi:hypothetical protein